MQIILFITPLQHFLTQASLIYNYYMKFSPSPFIITGTFTVDDNEITKTIHRVHEDHHYVLCPHTAVAVAYHYRCVMVDDLGCWKYKEGKSWIDSTERECQN